MLGIATVEDVKGAVAQLEYSPGTSQAQSPAAMETLSPSPLQRERPLDPYLNLETTDSQESTDIDTSCGMIQSQSSLPLATTTAIKVEVSISPTVPSTFCKQYNYRHN